MVRVQSFSLTCSPSLTKLVSSRTSELFSSPALKIHKSCLLEQHCHARSELTFLIDDQLISVRVHLMDSNVATSSRPRADIDMSVAQLDLIPWLE